jgi:hypothetical protein
VDSQGVAPLTPQAPVPSASTSGPRTTGLSDLAVGAERRDRTPGFDDGVMLRALLDDLAPARRVAFVATQVLGRPRRGAS